MASRSGRERRASRQDGGELHGEPQPDAGARREEGEQPDARLCLERALLPPGMTFVRAGASVIFFFMLYGFVFSAWYVAVGGDVCATERGAADRASREVDRLHAELQALRERGA
ncbi:unnamed protein product, partial [Prorocentrum cordatum]